MNHIDVIRSRMKVAQENRTTKLIYSNNWNGPVYIYVLLSALSLWGLSIQGEWVGGWWLGDAGQKFLSVLLV